MSEERIAAIRERLKTQWIDEQSAADITYLLTEYTRLRAVADAAWGMPEPVARLGTEQWCVMCMDRLVGSDTIHQHAPDCPWLLLQAALRALDGGAET